MKIVSFIGDEFVIKRILKHCGKWKEEKSRPPQHKLLDPPLTVAEPALDYTFF